MKSALFALALSPLLAAPALAAGAMGEPMSCVMGDQFVPCPPGTAMSTPNGGAIVSGPAGLVGGVVGGALAVPGAVLGGTAQALNGTAQAIDPYATGSITPASRRGYGAAPATTFDEDDGF